MSVFKKNKEIISGVSIANYGQERELNARPEEEEIANRVLGMFPDEKLRLVRKSNEYVTLKRGAWDIVRIKYTERAKWLMFPTIEAKKKKHYIEDVSEVEDYEASIRGSIETAKKF